MLLARAYKLNYKLNEAHAASWHFRLDEALGINSYPGNRNRCAAPLICLLVAFHFHISLITSIYIH